MVYHKIILICSALSMKSTLLPIINKWSTHHFNIDFIVNMMINEHMYSQMTFC